MHTQNWSTRHECVSFESLRAAAHRDVVEGLANGIQSAIPGTYITAFALNASSVTRAVRVKHTFWSTPGEWISMEFGQAFAFSSDAFSIDTT